MGCGIFSALLDIMAVCVDMVGIHILTLFVLSGSCVCVCVWCTTDLSNGGFVWCLQYLGSTLLALNLKERHSLVAVGWFQYVHVIFYCGYSTT